MMPDARRSAALPRRCGSATMTPITVTPMAGGGSCEVFALDRVGALGAAARDRATPARRPPTTCCASSASSTRSRTSRSRIARPVLALRRPRRVRRAVLRDGTHRRCPDPQQPSRSRGRPRRRRRRGAAGARRRARRHPRRRLGRVRSRRHGARRPTTCERQLGRWLSQLDSYGGRDRCPPRPDRRRLAGRAPPGRPGPARVHGDYKLDNVLFAPEAPPRAAGGRRLGDGVDRRPAGRPRVGDDLPPRSRGHDAARHGQGAALRPSRHCPTGPSSSSATATASGRDVARDRLVRRVRSLEARHRPRGQLRQVPARRSEKPIHEYFGSRPTCCSTAPRA